MIAKEQALIDEADDLTEEDAVEKEEYMKHGFGNWSKRDYQAFIKSCEKNGRYTLLRI
jgi:SWI/SNF-related matrix-associated actin-dependent regulator of chromatin subfamily A member 5